MDEYRVTRRELRPFVLGTKDEAESDRLRRQLAAAYEDIERIADAAMAVSQAQITGTLEGARAAAVRARDAYAALVERIDAQPGSERTACDDGE